MIRDAIRGVFEIFVNQQPGLSKSIIQPRVDELVSAIANAIEHTENICTRDQLAQALGDEWKTYQPDEVPRGTNAIVKNIAFDLKIYGANAAKFRALKQIGESQLAGVEDEQLFGELDRRYKFSIFIGAREDKSYHLHTSQSHPMGLWLLAGRAYNELKAPAFENMASALGAIGGEGKDPAAG